MIYAVFYLNNDKSNFPKIYKLNPPNTGVNINFGFSTLTTLNCIDFAAEPLYGEIIPFRTLKEAKDYIWDRLVSEQKKFLERKLEIDRAEAILASKMKKFMELENNE